MSDSSLAPTSQPKVLLLLSHPAMEASRINRALLEAAATLPLTVHDLYQSYPQQMIDVARERALLSSHDVLVLQHPLYWYSCPPLLKSWIDSVLTLGWAYGENGHGLQGKAWVHAISTGGAGQNYQRTGSNQFSLAELLRPFEQTANLCGMHFLQPFLTESQQVTEPQTLAAQAARYQQWLSAMLQGNLPAQVQTAHAHAAEYQKVTHD
jgi:glutathione-regulated potassium-efflux system ancillary protein KefG